MPADRADGRLAGCQRRLMSRRKVARAGTLTGMSKNPDLTGLLQAWSGGSQEALGQLVPLVHQELREIARRLLTREQQDAGLWPTELVQESYLRLLDWRAVHWQNRAHFFATAAGMMRRVLVDAARARRAVKRGQGAESIPIDDLEIPVGALSIDVIALEEAMQSLALVNERAARVVELRFFGGFSVEETAEALQVSVRTVINDWNMARACLYRTLSTESTPTAAQSSTRSPN